jgi:hypothetical protein
MRSSMLSYTTRRLLGFLGVTLLMSGVCLAEDATAAAAEVGRVTAWLAGEFDNWEQVTAAERENPGGSATRLHSSVVPVAVPHLGEHVLYVEQYENGDPENTVRQRVYSLRPDPDRGTVVMAIFRLPDPADAQLAHADPAALEGMDVERFELYEGCEIEWEALGDALVGTQPAGGCTVTTPGGMTLVFHKELRLERNLLLSREWATTEEGNPVWGDAEGETTRLRRCRFFQGWIGVRSEDEGVYFLDDLELHDQGGTLEVTDKEGHPTDQTIRLETTAAGETTPAALQLSILNDDDGEPRLTASARTDEAASTIGLDSGELLIWFATTESASVDLDLLTTWMTGSFSSAAQSEVDPEVDSEFFDVSLHMAPIWTTRTDGRWLYVEQAVAEHSDQPYRQRIYRLSEPAVGLFESRVFTLPDPTSAIGAWQLEDPLADLSPDDLTERHGCTIYLRRRGETFEGSTLGSLCTSSLRGASYATSEVVITPDGMVSWDRGFAADGGQVWGATSGGYVFDRLVPADPEGDVPPESESGSGSGSESDTDADTDSNSDPDPDTDDSGGGSGSGNESDPTSEAQSNTSVDGTRK